MKGITIPRTREIIVSVDETVYARMNRGHREAVRLARKEIEAMDRREVRGFFRGIRGMRGYGRALREARI